MEKQLIHLDDPLVSDILGGRKKYTMSTYTKNQMEFLFTLAKSFPGKTLISRKELIEAKNALGYSVIPVWITGDPQRRTTSRAIFSFDELAKDLTTLSVSNDTRGAPRKVLIAAVSSPKCPTV